MTYPELTGLKGAVGDGRSTRGGVRGATTLIDVGDLRRLRGLTQIGSISTGSISIAGLGESFALALRERRQGAALTFAKWRRRP